MLPTFLDLFLSSLPFLNWLGLLQFFLKRISHDVLLSFLYFETIDHRHLLGDIFYYIRLAIDIMAEALLFYVSRQTGCKVEISGEGKVHRYLYLDNVLLQTLVP